MNGMIHTFIVLAITLFQTGALNIPQASEIRFLNSSGASDNATGLLSLGISDPFDFHIGSDTYRAFNYREPHFRQSQGTTSVAMGALKIWQKASIAKVSKPFAISLLIASNRIFEAARERARRLSGLIGPTR